MIVPAWRKKIPTRSNMWNTTSFNRGKRKGGNSMIMGGGSPLSRVFLNNHAKPNAPPVPSAYMSSMSPTLAPTGTRSPGSNAAIMSR